MKAVRFQKIGFQAYLAIDGAEKRVDEATEEVFYHIEPFHKYMIASLFRYLYGCSLKRPA